MNMSGLLAFGVDVEKTYGTLFYTMINFWLMILSNCLSMLFFLFMAYCLPIAYRGGPSNFFQCGVGYSNILFGIALIFSYKGDPTVNFLGLCRFEKKYVPWFYLLAIYVTIPNSSLVGHLFGIFAGLLIKFGGLYIIFPRHEWLNEFEYSCGALLKEHTGYCKAQDDIEKDFDAYIFTASIRKIRYGFLRIKHRLLGYDYVGP